MRTVNGRYELLEALGEGSSGETYRARALARPEEELALKLLTSDEKLAADLFRSEFRLLTSLRHPNIRRVFDLDVDQTTGRPFYTAEFIQGKDLLAAAEGAPIETVIQWAVQVCRALHFLHSRGIIHNDIKTQNVLVSSGPEPTARLIDFGFWSLQDPGSDVARGTAQYLAPERIRFGCAEPSSDFYALGVLLYRVFTGRFPFEASDLPGLYRLHLDASPAPPHRIRPDLGESLSRLILRLLEKDPARRYPDAAGVIRALAEVAGRRFTLQTAATVPSHVVGWELVGRDREMRRLRELLTRTARGSAPDPWHVVLRGPMGLGKSRLLSEVRQEAELRRILWLQGNCYHQSADPLLPIRTLARSAASRLGTRRRAARDPLTAFADQLLDTATTRPVILAVEDLHSAESPLLRWLEALGRRIDSSRRSGRGAPALMMITTRRPDEASVTSAIDPLMALPGSEEIQLEPVPAHAWRSYVMDAFGASTELADLADEVAHRSGGVPLFFTELLRLLLEQNVLRFDGQDWTLPRDWKQSLRVPARAAQFIKARLRELPQHEVLELLALRPGPVSWEFLKGLHEGGDESLTEQLAALRQRQLVLAHRERGRRSYEIAHPSYREVIEGGLPVARRRSLHRTIAERLTDSGADDASRQREIAHHWFEASEPERAIPYARAAVQAARDRGEDSEAIALARRVLAHASTDRLAVHADLTELLTRQGELLAAIRTGRRGLKEARRAQDAAHVAGASRVLARLYGQLGKVTAAERYARDALEAAADVSELELARARTVLAQVLVRRGAAPEALALVDDALQFLTTAGHREEEAHARMLRAELLTADHEAASEELLTAIRCFRDTEDRFGAIEAEVRLGRLLRAHDPERCLRHAASARRRAKRAGHRGLLGQAESLLSWLCMGRERYRQAFRHARTSYEIAREIGTVQERVESTVQLAGSHYCVGSGDVALRYLREAMGLRHTFPHPAMLGRVRLAAGRAVLSMGRPGRAVRSLRSLLRHAVAQGDRLLLIEGRIFLARALFEGSPGSSHEPERLVREAMRDLDGMDQAETEALALQTLAQIQTSLGQRHLARETFERAVELLRGRSVYAYDGLEVALTDLAEFLLEDEPLRAHTLLKEALPRLEHKVRCGMRRGPLDRARVLAGRCEMVLGDRRQGTDRSTQAARLLEVNRLLNSELKLLPLLERILEVAVEVLGAERGLVLLRRQGETVPRVSRGAGGEDDRFSATVVSEVMDSGQSLRIENALEDDRLAAQASVLELHLCSILAVPLRSRGETTGVIYLEDRRRVNAFGPDDLDTLEAIADQAGIALTNSHLVETLLERQRELEGAQRRIENLNAALRDRVDQQSDTIRRMSEDLVRVRGELQRRFGPAAIVGESKAIVSMLETVTRLAPSTVPVYLYGESGSGKDLIARSLHYAGPRAEREFVSMNCAAVPSTLLETELFGHVKGAFTGAVDDRVGLLEQADGGTLFLDEVAEMSLAMQAKLLRVLEDGQVRRVGAVDPVQVDVRLVSATNRDLAELVASGEFRGDLFYRLNVFRLDLPPLRDRREDIPALIDSFVERHLEPGQEAPVWSPAARRALMEHHWPGNVRELENEVRRALLLCEGVVLPEHLSPHVVTGRPASRPGVAAGGGPAATVVTDPDATLAEATADLERAMIQAALDRNRHNRTRAARQLGIPKSSLYNKLKRHGLGDRAGSGNGVDSPAQGPRECGDHRR